MPPEGAAPHDAEPESQLRHAHAGRDRVRATEPVERGEWI